MLPDEGGIIKIFHVLCSANSKALTVEELEGRRKKVVVQVLDELHNDVCRAVNAAAATADFQARVKRDSDARDHWKRKFIASIKEESAARVAVYKALPDSAYTSIDTLGEAVSQGLSLPLLAQGKYLLWLEDPSLSLWEMGNPKDSKYLGFNASRGRRLARRRLLLQESAPGPETVALALEDCRDRRLVTGAGAAGFERKDLFSGETPLIAQVQLGEYENAKRLLQAGADANAATAGGERPLLMTAKEGRDDLVQLLTSFGAEVDGSDSKGKTALHWASEGGHVAAVQYLLTLNADLEATDERGMSALMLAICPKQTLWVEAIGQGHMEVIGQLLGKGADVNAQNQDGETALMLASEGHAEVVGQLLDKGADVNTQNQDGETALMLASQGGHTEVVGQLLDKGADVNTQNKMGRTALIAACSPLSSQDCTEVVGQLLDKGADVNVQCKGPDVNEIWNGMTALMLASERGNTEIVGQLLHKGAHVNTQHTNGNTALSLSKDAATFDCLRVAGAKMPDITDDNKNSLLLRYAHFGDASLLREVLQAGANLAHTNEKGKTAMDFANTEEVKVMLREHGGRHSLFHAVQHGMLEVVAELIKEGVDVHEEDNTGDTALYYADEIEDEENRAAVLSLLAEHGLKEEEEEEED
jgi:ankyrin repeat protein